jgi:hypothetical protein
MKLIHLISPHTNAAFCGEMAKDAILTYERPPNREVRALCKMCKRLYNKNLWDEDVKRQEALNARSNREKFHDWLETLSYFGDSDMEAILYPVSVVMTCGLVIPGKYLAKLLLKAGI